MIIYPAIDIKDGKCVRLVQGKFDSVTTYSDEPFTMALKWASCGAEYLHVVDLDGARTGRPINHELIGKISSSIDIPVQIGGGIRSFETIEDLFNRGVSRVILGTSVVKNPELVEKALRKFKNKIAIGIDAKGGKVSVDGWEKNSDVDALELAKKVESIGAVTIIYTDISRDGMLKGPNLFAMERMATSVGIDVIASGGVGCLEDVKNLKETGVFGVIIGKALYTGNVDLTQAIKIARRTQI